MSNAVNGWVECLNCNDEIGYPNGQQLQIAHNQIKKFKSINGHSPICSRHNIEGVYINRFCIGEREEPLPEEDEE